jgi:hypothetical protein
VDNRSGPTDGSSALSHSWSCWHGIRAQSITRRHLADAEPAPTVSKASSAPPSAACPFVRPLIASLLAVSALGVGCVFFRTQAYDFAQERWAFCENKFPASQLQQIEPDGLIRFYDPDPATASGMRDCLNQTAERQSSRVLAAPKPPLAVVSPPLP